MAMYENQSLLDWAGGNRATLAILITDGVGWSALGRGLRDRRMKDEVRDPHFAWGGDLVTNGIVRVPLERNVRIASRHPRVERIVQEQVCKERADDPTLRRSRCARHDAAVLHLHRRLQPALAVEQHPRAVRMMTDRLEQQLPIDTVEVTFDVDLEHPVIAPATLTSLAYGFARRSAGPVAIRVGMEHRLQIRPQVASGALLGDTVGDRRAAQRARATVGLRNLDPPHRRRKIAPRRQPVPELVEVVRKINLEVCNRLCVYPSRSLVGLHTFEGFPDFPLGDVERLCLAHGLLPSPVGPWPRLNNAAPSVQLHYRAFIPTTSCSAPVLRFGTLVLAVCAAWTSPLASERQVLTFHTRAWLSFAPPTCRMPLGQASGFFPSRSRKKWHPPVSTSPNPLSTLHRRFACARLSQPCLPGSGPDVSATLTTIALDDSSLRWLETCT